ncbi:hypothetical protein NP493_87g09005 [Ridgeia piscesae]|uniref:Uncharacterized protein n=1 Tax=Ridgeia piscesae TaxID=27915 RepID=A0AAD9P948_RIDPI|nr:hypothetical protein NP493_87g09005 [Ridgeia piscesae]
MQSCKPLSCGTEPKVKGANPNQKIMSLWQHQGRGKSARKTKKKATTDICSTERQDIVTKLTEMPRHWHMIDFIIKRCRDKMDIHSTRSMRRAKCWTDHEMLRSKVAVRTRQKHNRQGTSPLALLYLPTSNALRGFPRHGDCVYMQSRKSVDLVNLAHFRANTKTTRILMRELLFAGDSVAHSAKEMQKTVDAFSDASKKFGLKINI